MKKLILLLSLCLIGVLLFSCTKADVDREKIVEMTIYPETGYGGSIMSDIWSDQLIFSDSDSQKKQQLTDIITEGFDFDYERGNEYKFQVKKIWMQILHKMFLRLNMFSLNHFQKPK